MNYIFIKFYTKFYKKNCNFLNNMLNLHKLGLSKLAVNSQEIKHLRYLLP